MNEIYSDAGVATFEIQFESVEDFVRQLMHQEGAHAGPTTAFYPLTPMERIAMDEAAGSFPPLSDQFRKKVRLSIRSF